KIEARRLRARENRRRNRGARPARTGSTEKERTPHDRSGGRSIGRSGGDSRSTDGFGRDSAETGREQIVDLEGKENAECRIGRVARTPLLDRLRQRGDRLHARRADAETFFVQQPLRRVSGVSRFGNAAGDRSWVDDFR